MYRAQPPVAIGLSHALSRIQHGHVTFSWQALVRTARHEGASAQGVFAMKTLGSLTAASLFLGALSVHAQAPWADQPQVLATGQRITPLAAPGSTIQHLNPGLAAYPDYEISQIMSATASPDGKTLLVLSSGYND